MKTNRDLLKPCSRCKSMNFEIKRVANADGRIVFPYFCVDCGNRSPIVEKAIVAEIIHDA